MTYAKASGHRGATAAVLAVGGGALAAATWIGGDPILSFVLIAFYLLAAGIVIFSGSLYVLALTNIRWLGAITPLGGLCFLAGWLWLIAAPPR